MKSKRMIVFFCLLTCVTGSLLLSDVRKARDMKKLSSSISVALAAIAKPVA